MSSLEVRRKILSHSAQSLEQVRNRDKLGHILHMSTEPLPLCVLFFDAGNGKMFWVIRKSVNQWTVSGRCLGFMRYPAGEGWKQ